MHIHLDAVGGISGNMFIGALLDVFPEQVAALSQQLELAGFSDLVALQSNSHNDGILTGTFFNVSPSHKNHSGEHKHEHEHRAYALIRETLKSSSLDSSVKKHALGIFQYLAEAEASVHGTEVDDVQFHEVGAWDSIADVVCSAYLIERAAKKESCTWSVSALPLGNGFVQTAHGKLPVPAPAVTLLLKGFSFYRDDIEGERLTPTGAAILRYLINEFAGECPQMQLNGSGYGFGSRRFAGISNVLRALVFATEGSTQKWQEQNILQINFEVDDQSGEELAEALSKLRAMNGVYDVCQFPVYGKKGRLATSVQVLAELSESDEVLANCFAQTTTLGLRKQIVSRAVLPREETCLEHEGQSFRIKQVQRPSGVTRKIELDDIAQSSNNQQQRQALRSILEVDKNND